MSIWTAAIPAAVRPCVALGLALPLMACQSLPSQWSDLWAGLWGGRKAEPGLPPPMRSDRFLLPPSGEDVVGQIQVLHARREDTLADIARRYDLGYDEILQANPGVDPWLPRAGTRIVLPTQFILPDGPRKGIVLNVASMRLFYYPPAKPGEQAVVVTHPIGIGREEWPTPLGKTVVTAKAANPTWNVPESIRAEHAEAGQPLPKVVPPGPDNPLGLFALRLGFPGYLIHGTNQSYGIGMRATHGCIRLYPEDIESLFGQVAVGTPVRIVNQPYRAGWRDGVLYLEAHTPLERNKRITQKRLKSEMAAALKKSPGSGRHTVDWTKVQALVASPQGFPVPISQGTPSRDQVVAAAPLVLNLMSEAAPVPSAPPAPTLQLTR